MTETTPRLALPMIQPGQAQKEVFHNEAIALLDGLLHPAVEAVGLDTPPASPAIGQCWIVGGAPTGDWSGQIGVMACYGSGGWRFTQPVPGMLAWSLQDLRWVWHDGNSWISGDWPVAGISIAGARILGPQRPGIAVPAGGATIDVEARTALSAVIVTLRAHGLIAT